MFKFTFLTKFINYRSFLFIHNKCIKINSFYIEKFKILLGCKKIIAKSGSTQK